MKIALILASAVLALSTAAAAQSYPPLQGRPVIDAANVLDADAEARLNARLFEYERTTGHQLVVATVPSLEGRDIETYATGYFRALRLGDKDLNDGVLLLHAPTERKMRIEVGYGLEGVLTDADSAMIIQDILVPAFKAGEFGRGLEEGAGAIIAETDMTMEELAAMEARKKAAEAAAFAAFWDFIGTVLVWVLAAIAIFFSGKGLLWVSNIPRRRAARKAAIKRGVNAIGDIIRLVIKRAKEDDLRVRAARLAEERRMEENARQAEEARQAAVAHAAMLAAMTPLARAQYDANLRQKARDEAARQEAARQAAIVRERARAAAQKIAEAEAAVRRREQDSRDEEARLARRRRQQEDDDRRRRQQDDDRRRRDESPWSGSSGGGFGGGGFGGGGGSTGGGGASGDY